MTKAMIPGRQHARRTLAMAVAGCLLAAAPALAQLNGRATILLKPIHLP